MGGTIEVLTSPGSGTEMVIRLKFKLAKAEDIPDTPKSAEQEEQIDFRVSVCYW